MNKKVIVGCIGAVFILTAISLASALNVSSERSVVKKESPLFQIRTKQSIGEKIEEIKTEFLGERIFFLPFQSFINSLKVKEYEENMMPTGFTCVKYPSCRGSPFCTIHGCVLDNNDNNDYVVRQQLDKTSRVPTACLLECFTQGTCTIGGLLCPKNI